MQTFKGSELGRRCIWLLVGLNGGKDYGVWNKEANLVVKVYISE